MLQRPLIEFVNLVFSGGQVGVQLLIPGKGWNESITSRSQPEEHCDPRRPCEFSLCPLNAGRLPKFCGASTKLWQEFCGLLTGDLPEPPRGLGRRCDRRVWKFWGSFPALFRWVCWIFAEDLPGDLRGSVGPWRPWTRFSWVVMATYPLELDIFQGIHQTAAGVLPGFAVRIWGLPDLIIYPLSLPQ